MFQCIKYEDKREVFGLKIHSFSTLDRIKKYDDSDNEKNAEKPYSIKVGETKRTINLYAIATTKFQIAVYINAKPCAPFVDKQVPVTTPFYNLNGVVCYTFDLAIRAKYNELKQPNEMFLRHNLVQR